MSDSTPIRVSLREWLTTGQLGPLRPGLSPEEVRRLLGEPDATGGVSRRYPRPSIYVYGSVEVHFCQRPPHEIIGIFWEVGERGALQLPSPYVIADWGITPGMRKAEVEAYLHAQRLGFEYAPHQPPSTFMLPSGVRITFNESGCLDSIYAG